MERGTPMKSEMPVVVKVTLSLTLGLAILGGLYLIAVRGEALMLDIGELAAMCF